MKIGDIISLKTYKIKEYEKVVPLLFEGKPEGKLSNKLFEIIGDVSFYESYLVLVSDGMVGWHVSPFHVNYLHVASKFLGKKFFEINNTYYIL